MRSGQQDSSRENRGWRAVRVCQSQGGAAAATPARFGGGTKAAIDDCLSEERALTGPSNEGACPIAKVLEKISLHSASHHNVQSLFWLQVSANRGRCAQSPSWCVLKTFCINTVFHRRFPPHWTRKEPSSCRKIRYQDHWGSGSVPLLHSLFDKKNSSAKLSYLH